MVILNASPASCSEYVPSNLLRIIFISQEPFWVLYLTWRILHQYCLQLGVLLNAKGKALIWGHLFKQTFFDISVNSAWKDIFFPFGILGGGLPLCSMYHFLLLCQYSYCLLTSIHSYLVGSKDVPDIQIANMHLQLQMWKGVFVSCFFQWSCSKSFNYRLAETACQVVCLLAEIDYSL